MKVGDLVKSVHVRSISSQTFIGVVVMQKDMEYDNRFCKVFWSDTGAVSGWIYESQVELLEEK